MIRDLHSVLSLLEGGFNGLKVLVVGDIMLDRYIHGEVERISPEAPVPVIRHAQRYERAGGAANVAMDLAGLGCRALLAGNKTKTTKKANLKPLPNRPGAKTEGAATEPPPPTPKTHTVGPS